MPYKLIILIVWVFICNACKKENACDCVKSTGKTNVIYRDKSNFNCIKVSDKMDLFLTQGNNFEVKVEAGANLQPLIKTELIGDTLKVFNTNRCNWVRGYKHKIQVYITAPYFKYILHNGLGTIKNTNTITQDEISLKTTNSGDIDLTVNTTAIVCSAHGNGDIYLSGTTKNLAHDFTGTNYLYAYGLTTTNYVYLHSVTIGKAFINAPENGLMDISIDKAGNVYYKGNPKTINLTRRDKGDLIKE